MSKNESKNDNMESAKKAGQNAIASILSLKENNPKVLYGAIGGIILLVLIMMMSGGGSGVISGSMSKNLVVGQSYILKSPNTYSSNSTIRLVSVPGSMAAYDDTEENDREGCLHLPEGSSVTVKDLTDAFGKKNAFAKVAAETGDCVGKGGWVSVNNIQTK